MKLPINLKSLSNLAFKNGQPAIKSLIASETAVRGDILFKDGLRIDGEILGNIRSDSSQASILVISETARVVGEVHAANVIINGSVQGPVYATELLELQPKARIDGDVNYFALEMHQGARITGQLKPMHGAGGPVLLASE